MSLKNKQKILIIITAAFMTIMLSCNRYVVPNSLDKKKYKKNCNCPKFGEIYDLNNGEFANDSGRI